MQPPECPIVGPAVSSRTVGRTPVTHLALEQLQWINIQRPAYPFAAG
jgi:hypothetical protein